MSPVHVENSNLFLNVTTTRNIMVLNETDGRRYPVDTLGYSSGGRLDLSGFPGDKPVLDDLVILHPGEKLTVGDTTFTGV